MDVNNINPFIKSFTSVMPQLGFTEIKKGKLSLKDKDLVCSGIVVVVGIVGDIKGNIVYSLDIESAKKIASTMMMGQPVEEFNEISKSALSELSNMLTANAITVFSEQGVEVDISTPTLFEGRDISIKMSSKKVICIELSADEIPIEINISIGN